MRFKIHWEIVFVTIGILALIFGVTSLLSCKKKSTEPRSSPRRLALCSVSPTWIDFGTIPYGTYKDTSFTISNDSEYKIMIGTVSQAESMMCSYFSIMSEPHYVLRPGQSAVIKIRFTPPLRPFPFYRCYIAPGYASCPTVVCYGRQGE
jgi:hypothetical protein